MNGNSLFRRRFRCRRRPRILRSLISLFVGQQEQRPGYNSKIAHKTAYQNLKQLCGPLRTKTPYLLRSGENCYTRCGHDNIATSNEPKKVWGFRPLSVNGRSKNAYVKAQSLYLNATISSHWWGKWYKGQLRMNVKVNSVVKEVLFNAYWLYTRNHCLQTLF